EVALSGASAEQALQRFAAGKADLVLGGTFVDLPLAEQARLPRGSLNFDPASGLFGLVPVRAGGDFDKPEVRQLLSEAINRDGIVTALGVPGLAARATLLEPGLDGVPAPTPPAWLATPLAERIPSLSVRANRLFPNTPKPVIRLLLPEGPGAE